MERVLDDASRWDRWQELVDALKERDSAAASEARRAFIASLDDPDTVWAQEAQATLESFPYGVIEPLLEAVPTFGRFGCLCAIELFTHLKAPEAEGALIRMLEHEDSTVREWSAQALAELGSVEAVPALRRAYERWRTSGEPPDWPEPLNIRRALTTLGAREEILPLDAKSLAVQDEDLGRHWRISDCATVVNALADAGQTVTDVMVWTRWRETWRLDLDATEGYQLDYASPWRDLVEHAREEILTSPMRQDPDSVVTINWIDISDL